MVEGVRAGGIGGLTAQSREGTRLAEGPFLVSEATSPVQKARLSAIDTVGLESLLTLQAVGEAEERDRAARRRGTALVAALSKLQVTLLAAGDPSGALHALGALTADGPAADDPRLDAILRAIVLRSRVEIARLGVRHPPG